MARPDPASTRRVAAYATRALVFLLTLLACTRVAPPNAAPPAPRDHAPRCLPLVSGCGCAYVCAVSMRALDGGVHEVAHDLQDSRLDRVTVERWCFDDAGRGSPAPHACDAQRRCLDVFFDGTPCGGECIPRVDLLRCVLVDQRCAPEGVARPSAVTP